MRDELADHEWVAVTPTQRCNRSNFRIQFGRKIRASHTGLGPPNARTGQRSGYAQPPSPEVGHDARALNQP
jgi:hypothetical protein